MKRIILAGILGGVVMFILGAITHMFTPLGTAGMRNLPNEDTVTSTLKTNIPDAGLYFYPGMDMSGGEAAPTAWAEKYKAGPTGLLVYSPTGGEALDPKLMVIELLTNILACLLAAFVVGQTSARFWGKALLVTVFGLIAWASLSLSYWNWYKFPGTFVVAEGVDQVLGFFGAGLAIARMQRSR